MFLGKPVLNEDGSLERIEAISCFAHGQLYVALSRVGDPRKVCVYLSGADYIAKQTEFVVYREALLANAVDQSVTVAVGDHVQCLRLDGSHMNATVLSTAPATGVVRVRIHATGEVAEFDHGYVMRLEQDDATEPHSENVHAMDVNPELGNVSRFAVGECVECELPDTSIVGGIVCAADDASSRTVEVQLDNSNEIVVVLSSCCTLSMDRFSGDILDYDPVMSSIEPEVAASANEQPGIGMPFDDHQQWRSVVGAPEVAMDHSIWSHVLSYEGLAQQPVEDDASVPALNRTHVPDQPHPADDVDSIMYADDFDFNEHGEHLLTYEELQSIDEHLSETDTVLNRTDVPDQPHPADDVDLIMYADDFNFNEHGQHLLTYEELQSIDEHLSGTDTQLDGTDPDDIEHVLFNLQSG